MNTPAPLPASQRTAYQFPVYRWIGWLAVAGFAIGLTMMFFIAGMFGWPAPILWASVVALFTFGALLMDRPRLLLLVMLFYFLLVPGNRMLGIFPVPLLGSMNKFFFLPFIAVIVMNWIQRRQLKEATLYPVAFLLLTGISWYINGKPSVFSTLQLILILLRLYILWYYCRLTCTFEEGRQVLRWVWGYIIYATVQFFYNVLWQRGPWPRYHPDSSGGMFGPTGMGQAHLVGYLSVFALLLMAGWWIGGAAQATSRRRGFMILFGLIIGYNLIFMTDTKHALVLLPLAFIPFLLHPKFPVKIRMWLIAAAILFATASVAYFHLSMGNRDLQRYFDSVKQSPKGDMFYAVTVDFSHLVPYPLFGAGPGQFASESAIASRAPLARRYIIPYLDDNRRRGYFGRGGTVVSASVAGSPTADVFTLAGEFGWAGIALYYAFWGWVIWKLIRKSMEAEALRSGLFGVYLALACCLIFQAILMTFTSILNVPMLMYPIWMLVGRMWDMKEAVPAEPAVIAPVRI
jgi:hypothetical protein